MVTLAIISAILFAIYLFCMAKLHGVQPSVSDNYYVSPSLVVHHTHDYSFDAPMSDTDLDKALEILNQ